MNFDEYNNEINNLLKNLKKTIKQINILEKLTNNKGGANTGEQNKVIRYKITPTMSKPTSVYISSSENISTTESDLELMKNKIRELLNPDSNLTIDTKKFEIIMQQIKELKQKMLNLITKLEKIKQNKESDVLDVNTKIASLIDEMKELENTVNLNPEATKGQVIKGGSTSTSITENKIKNIGNTIEKIRLLLGDKTNQDKKKIDLDALNDNYNLFINNLQNFLDDFLKNKDQSSTINIEETNKKIQELSKSFEDLKSAFE